MTVIKRIKALIRRKFPTLKYWYDTRRAFRNAKEVLKSSGDLSDGEKKLLDRVSLRVDSKDTMYNKYGGALHYLSVGLSASRCIKEVLSNVHKDIEIKTILDFPSGHGRVLRYLKATFPNSKITASEIDVDSLKFCRQNFSVNTFLSKINFNEIQLPQKFDFIWCGSLFTHIDEQATSNLLKFFYDHLSENGVCIFTTHGKFTIDLIESKKNTYRLTEDAQQRVIQEYKTKGYGYVNYNNREGYGISIVHQQRLIELAKEVGDWNMNTFIQQGWDNHQDVYAFQKAPK